jgi:hypothetical protein
MFGACNAVKTMSPESFKAACENQKPGASLEQVKQNLVFIGAQQHKCDKN